MIKKSKAPAQVLPTHSVSEALQLILRHNLTYSTEWEDAARNWHNIAGVHQTRVSFRRMRSALTTFRLAIPKSAMEFWSSEMRALAGELGKARDLDVFIDEALGAVHGKLLLPGEDKLTTLVQEHRAAAYEKVCAMLDSARYARFKQDFGLWVENRGWEQAEFKKKQRKHLESNLLVFSRKVLDRQAHRVLDVGTHVDRDSAEAMHRLRIECKKLRYAAEFFSPVFTGMDEYIHHMKGLQDLLGVMNDVKVMSDLLGEVLAGIQDSDALTYAGGIVGWRSCYFYQLLDSFDERWDELVEARRPWWKKSEQK